MRVLQAARTWWPRSPVSQSQHRWISGSASEHDLRGLSQKWQPYWELERRKPRSGDVKPLGKAYVLPMFPYPSGTLHLGHLRVYTVSDVLARFKYMQGHDVLHPIGWDAFGLPAENAAIERGVHPAEWTNQNIAAMKEQMMEMGGQWSWDREFRTCDPSFYKHTQRLFLMLYKRGLAYQSESLVNWDPVDQTVLANEQVDANGRSWRSGALVEQRMLKQWFLKIKEFQAPLLADLDSLLAQDAWPERVVAMQRNWMRKSSGVTLSFEVVQDGTNAVVPTHSEPVEVFTTRLDTLPGVKYLALSLQHPLTQLLAKTDKHLRNFLAQAQHTTMESKQGFRLRDVYARNPLARLLEDPSIAQRVPIFVAPYVLDVASSAVMGVPAHDARDFAFWKENGLSSEALRFVVSHSSSAIAPKADVVTRPMLEKGYVISPDERLHGLHSDDAVTEIIKICESGEIAMQRTDNWRLRDWLISRQRYWGTPIPVVHCPSCGCVPVPEEELPVVLPNLPASDFQQRSGNPLAADEIWKNTSCPQCHGSAERDTDTMDTFMDSSWYFFRFLDPHNTSNLIDAAKADAGMPVDIYVGGVEHAILHLLYARFISKFLTDTHWSAGTRVLGEPFKKLISQGMVHGKTYSDPDSGRFLRPEELDLTNKSQPLIAGTKIPPIVSFEKMSKSKYNGVDPRATITKFGIDATRAHMLFQAPVSDVLEWDEQKITGVQRWLKRVLQLSTCPWIPEDYTIELQELLPTDIDLPILSLLRHLQKCKLLYPETALPARSKPHQGVAEDQNSDPAAELLRTVHETISSVRTSYAETYALNTIVSDLMTLTNAIHDAPKDRPRMPLLKYIATTQLLRLLAPICPSVAEQGWHNIHSTANSLGLMPEDHVCRDVTSDSGPSVFSFGFPEADADGVKGLSSTIVCTLQIDGRRKMSATVRSAPHTDDVPQEEHFIQELLGTVQGRTFLARDRGYVWKNAKKGEGRPGTLDDAEGSLFPEREQLLPEGWQILVANKGKIVNLVSPKSKTRRKATG